jgi:thioesterase domain-containing protein
VIFVGHSCGGRYSLHVARRLQRVGIAVDLLVCLDVAWALPVPSNVKKAVSIFIGRPRFYPARPLVASDPAATEVTNIDLGRTAETAHGTGLNHLTFTDSRWIQDLVANQVLGVVSHL